MTSQQDGFVCPVPDSGGAARITLAHGEGGRLMRQLLHESILPRVADAFPTPPQDAAVLPAPRHGLALSTDSYVAYVGEVTFFDIERQVDHAGFRVCIKIVTHTCLDVAPTSVVVAQ